MASSLRISAFALLLSLGMPALLAPASSQAAIRSGMAAQPSHRYQISVPEMHCESCSEALTTTFRNRPEVSAAEADVEHRRVTVVTKPGRALSEDQMTKLVEASGFTVGKITAK